MALKGSARHSGTLNRRFDGMCTSSQSGLLGDPTRGRLLLPRGRGGSQLEGASLDRLANQSLTDAACANHRRFTRSVRGIHFDRLQVGAKLSSADAGDLGTNAAQVFGLTTSLNLVAHFGTLSANRTAASHDPTSTSLQSFQRIREDLTPIADRSPAERHLSALAQPVFCILSKR